MLHVDASPPVSTRATASLEHSRRFREIGLHADYETYSRQCRPSTDTSKFDRPLCIALNVADVANLPSAPHHHHLRNCNSAYWEHALPAVSADTLRICCADRCFLVCNTMPTALHWWLGPDSPTCQFSPSPDSGCHGVTFVLIAGRRLLVAKIAAVVAKGNRVEFDSARPTSYQAIGWLVTIQPRIRL